AGGSFRLVLPPPAYDNRLRGARWGGWLVAADLPDRAVAVLGHEERSVWRHRYADRPAPGLSLGGEEAGHEVLIGTGRLVAVVEGQPDDLVAGTDFAIPRAVQGDEGIAAILLAERLVVVEGDVERRR